MHKINIKRERLISCLIVLLAGMTYFCWALRLPVAQAPDEAMRYDIPKWIYSNNCLPTGNEEELRNPIWGISYGYTPYLSSLIGIIFMKIVGLFTEQARWLIMASRLSSVLCGVGTVIMSLKIGKEIFIKKREKYLMTILIAFLPQFVFLCSYLNNDVISIFSVSMILYFWIKGIKNHWNNRSCIGLGIAVGICALSYYLGYSFILFSIVIFIASILKDGAIENKMKTIIEKGFLVFIVAFIIAGWFFIRNFLIHDGDFLGMKTSNISAELYAQAEFKPSNRSTFRNQGKTILNMLTETTWITGTFCSYYAVFGYMNIILNDIFYLFFAIFLIIGVIFFIKRWWKGDKRLRLFYMAGGMACVVTIFLSIWNSYASDYQSQGRYIMSTMPFLMLIMTKGYSELGDIIEQRYQKKFLLYGITAGWLFIFCIIFLRYIRPFCMGGIL